MRFEVEIRPLTSEYPAGAVDAELRSRSLDAEDASRAIEAFSEAVRGEVMSTVKPRSGQEWIATMRKQDMLYMLRVHPA